MRKQTPKVITLLLLVVMQTSAFCNHVDEYIANYHEIAIREMQRSGIPASITLSQGIIESAWGGGELASQSNNHFGIKCKDYWRGPTYYIEDDDYENGKLVKSCFRAYDDPESSYIDHTNFLMDNVRYANLFQYDRTDYVNWAKGLKSCGYATDPAYAKKLIEMVERYGLDRFDVQVEMPTIAQAPTYHVPTPFAGSNAAIDAAVQQEFYASIDEKILDIPPVYEIPEDYQRQAEPETYVGETPYKEPMKYEAAVAVINEELEAEQFNSTPQATAPIVSPHREAVILMAHTGTSNMQHLGRKPRSTSSAIR